MRLVLLLIISSFIVACQDDDDFSSQSIPGTDFFPLELGQNSIFQVDSIIYDDFNASVDTLSFQRREEIVDQFIDNSGRNVFIVELSFRDNDSADWVVQKNFTKLKTPVRVEVMEDNIIHVPLIFPIVENKRWNSNALNIFPERNFSYKNLLESFRVGEQEFDSTVTVAQIDEENLIERFFAEEKYAPGIGMIYRKDIALSTELNGEIRSGFETTISLLETTFN